MTTSHRIAPLFYAVGMGLLFAFLQVGYFWELQFRLTAAYPSFLTVTLSWLVGGIVGLWTGQRSRSRHGAGWMIASLCAFGLVAWLLRKFPYQSGWLPVHGALIAVSGAQAGHFFAVNRGLLGSAGRLFLWENNGFVLGWLVGYVGYVKLGSSFPLAAPMVTGLLVLLLKVAGPRFEERFRPGYAQDGTVRWLLFLTGFNLILLNYTLIRQTTLAFRDLETSALVMVLAYFAGISLGYLASERVQPRTMARLLPVFLVFQVVLVAFVQLIVVYLGQLAPTNLTYALIFLLVAVGSTSLYSVFLPRFIQPDTANTSRYYSIEIVGSLCGLLTLGALSMAGMTAVYAAYFAAFIALAALAQVGRVMIGLLAAFSLLFLLGFDVIDRKVSVEFYKRFYSGRGIEQVIHTRYSPYHKIEVVKDGDGDRLLILNNHLQFGPSSHHHYSYFVAEYPAALLGNPTVAVLGCGSMSTVGRMGDIAEWITIVDIDRAVFETSRKYFAEFNRLYELRNWTFVDDDAKHFLGTTRQTFDLVVDDIPPAKTRQIALTYTREFFELVRLRLTPRGVFSMPSLTSLHAQRVYGKRILATMAAVFDRVYVINDGDTSYYFGTSESAEFNEETLRAAIDHASRPTVHIMLPDEVREHVKDTKIITINNMADLILY